MTKLPDEATPLMDVTPNENINNNEFALNGSGDDAEASAIQPGVHPEPTFVETGSVFDNAERFFLRADYIRIYDYLEEIYENYLDNTEPMAPVAVITGQPGIGA
jgi:hypothetical protein